MDEISPIRKDSLFTPESKPSFANPFKRCRTKFEKKRSPFKVSLDDTSVSRQKRKIAIKDRDSECLSTRSFCTFKDKNKTVHINQYKVIKLLGQGSYGTVKKVKDTKTNQVYAMKTMNKAFLKKQKMGKGNAYESVKAELMVLQKL